jgi:hypothetical protein
MLFMEGHVEAIAWTNIPPRDAGLPSSPVSTWEKLPWFNVMATIPGNRTWIGNGTGN